MKIPRVHGFLLIIVIGLMFHSCSESTGPGSGGNVNTSFSHVMNPGRSANDFLSDSLFDHLVVEVDYMPGYAPNQRALDSLKIFFEQRLHKSTITIQKPTEIPSAGMNYYSADQVRELEANHRSTFSRGDTLTAYILIVDGKYSDRNLLGIAYYNTSNAFFGPAYDEASSGAGSPSRYQIEAASFRHEFGHLFGLVAVPNSGTEMQTPHKDPEHGSHCNEDQCLMYYATETTDIVGNMLGEEIPSLDQNCIADLRANGGK